MNELDQAIDRIRELERMTVGGDMCQELEARNARLVRLLHKMRLIIPHAMPEEIHPGSCGPESGCDQTCADRAGLVKLASECDQALAGEKEPADPQERRNKCIQF